MLAREGHVMNHKKLLRLYREENLRVRRRRGRKRAMGTRAPMTLPQGPNQRWSLDFVSDTLVCHAPPDERLCFYRLPGEATKREIRFFYKRTHFVTRPMREFLRLLGNES